MAREQDEEESPEVLEPAAQTELEAAAREIDPGLLRWFGRLSLRQRLRASTRAARALGRFGRAPPSAGRP